MEISNILSFLLFAISLTIMPGPDNIYVLAESITRGARTGILISIGLISGIIIHTALAATGISIVFQQSEFWFSMISYLGAGYLFYLAYLATQEEQLTVEVKGTQVSQQSELSLIRKGFFMNVLNPKVSLFFLALLPQFITIDGWPVSLQMIVLGGIFMVQGIIIFAIIAMAAGRLRSVVSSSQFWTFMKWAKVLILVLLGISLLLVNK